MSKDNECTPLALWHLRSLNDSAIRSYYTYELLRKLLRSQEKSFLEEVSLPLEIAASVASVFALIQYPSSIYVVAIGYIVIMVALVSVPIAEKRLKKREALDNVVYLGIYFDEVAKYTSEIELAKSFEPSDAVRGFIGDARNALKVSHGFLQQRIEKLTKRGEYPMCLKKIGRDESWVQALRERAESAMGTGVQ